MTSTYETNRQALLLLSGVAAAFPLLVASHGVRAFGPTVVKMATVEHEDSPVGRQLREIGQHLGAESDGLVRIKVFTGGSLGDEEELLRRTAEGSLQVLAASAEGLGRVVPELGLLGCAFLFFDERHARRALDGPVRTLVRPLLESKGLVPGSWTEMGFRSWYTREKPVREPADLRGLRLRVGEGAARSELLRRLGAIPGDVAPRKMLESLEREQLDGFEAVPSTALAASWYRGIRHLTLSRHGYRAGMVVYSSRWFDGLPEELRQALTDIPHRYRERARSAVRAMTPGLLEVLRRRGVEIHRLKARERERFVDATREPLNGIAGRAGTRGRKLLEAVAGAR